MVSSSHCFIVSYHYSLISKNKVKRAAASEGPMSYNSSQDSFFLRLLIGKKLNYVIQLFETWGRNKVFPLCFEAICETCAIS